MKKAFKQFARKFILEGFMCAECGVIIDLESPGKLRTCMGCKS